MVKTKYVIGFGHTDRDIVKKLISGELNIVTYNPNESTIGEDEIALTPVLSGEFIFDMVDSYGLPLDIIQLEMQERKLAFDVLTFIKTAKKSANYENPDRLRILIFSSLPNNENMEIIKNNINMCIDHVYRPLIS